MPYPTPNGPTINDLAFQSYNQAGSVNTTAFVIPYSMGVGDVLNTRENVVLVLPGFTNSLDTSDFINTAENVKVTIDAPGPNQYSINVSDSVTTSENMDILRASARNVNVSDTVTTSENVVRA